jgi:hypothetical protein
MLNEGKSSGSAPSTVRLSQDLNLVYTSHHEQCLTAPEQCLCVPLCCEWFVSMENRMDAQKEGQLDCTYVALQRLWEDPAAPSSVESYRVLVGK